MDTLQNAEMEFEVILLPVEHPPKAARADRGDAAQRFVGHFEGIQLGPEPVDGLRQGVARVELRTLVHLRIDQAQVVTNLRDVDPGLHRKAVSQDTGLDIVIEEDSDDRILEARNHDDVVDELVVPRL